eukprot:TRINITY_DN10589_c0_g1_i1.p1 TRINITY_DN10589_c0_g1~~TRINITY_DN10589_c0_g1_i1.p1  ORF type:complete len:246 (-),score=20.66 TRINITY_DN10589_c0_g1_i1:142-879(-)
MDPQNFVLSVLPSSVVWMALPATLTYLMSSRALSVNLALQRNTVALRDLQPRIFGTNTIKDNEIKDRFLKLYEHYKEKDVYIARHVFLIQFAMVLNYVAFVFGIVQLVLRMVSPFKHPDISIAAAICMWITQLLILISLAFFLFELVNSKSYWHSEFKFIKQYRKAIRKSLARKTKQSLIVENQDKDTNDEVKLKRSKINKEETATEERVSGDNDDDDDSDSGDIDPRVKVSSLGSDYDEGEGDN